MNKLQEYRGFLLIDAGHCIRVRAVLAPGEGFTRQQFKKFFSYRPDDKADQEHAIALAKSWVDHETAD